MKDYKFDLNLIILDISAEATPEAIAEYYNKQTVYYNVYATTSLHYGIWKGDTQNSQEAHENTNRKVAELLNLNANDIVLDAGCGIGGPAIFMAENYKSNIIGITLSEVQLKVAQSRAKLSSEVAKLRFYVQNYTNTKFKENTFTKIYGLESVCHAISKIEFMKEAYRLMQPKGRLLVLDGFLIKKNLTKKDKKHILTCLKGWLIPNFVYVDDFKNDLVSAGFRNIEFIELTDEIQQSIRNIYYNGVFAYPIIWALTKLNWLDKSFLQTLLLTMSQKYLLDNKVGIYGAFIAEK